MNSIFTRTYIVLMLLIPVGFVVSGILIDSLLEDTDGNYFQRDATVESRLVEMELLKQPPETWAKYVDAYTPVFETRLSVLAIANLEASKYGPVVKPNEDTILTGRSFEDWWLLHPLPDGEQFLLVEEADVTVHLDEWLTVLTPLLVITLIVGGALWLISRDIAKPIQALSEAAYALGDGRLGTRADPDTVPPIRGLARSFNRMANELQTLINDQTVIIGALPHELRTPISRARFALDMTRSIDEIDALHRQLEKVDEYVAGLESVVEDALMLSRVQLTESPQTTAFSLRDVIAELCDLRSGDTNHVLNCRCEVDDPVVGDEKLIRLAIGNLLDNALKYGETKVRIHAHRESDGAIEVLVDDDGPGIPGTQRKTVFAPFYRLDDSRSRTTGGIGLGLAMVAVIARRLRGSVSVSDNEWGGARLRFCWPQTEAGSPT